MFAVLVCIASSPSPNNSIVLSVFQESDFLHIYLCSYEEADPTTRVTGSSQVKKNLVWDLARATGKEVVSIYWGY